ncbi:MULTISPECIES: signal peptide peptidase SppA [Shewanella]|jgi:protease-4|uniref:Signal peptide peptidase SppA n=1 Tax=Shewanella vesiculosa TaxID=518738 RepID=A0ABV0FS69_9GAMM|nr:MULTISPECIES: signal peptide peptidase SppA [Shewanella]NCQ46003.1 signal peptide peptidase SppA [Shewanella frigidimarina]MBB1321970.1 signal peptide peptidase SppA [Shewanella sp. SR43-8]NCO70461.1 signal peptide peptidase SppA [Shewanella vesiculosa]NCP36467.1 signal peptide peptidase SppA [Shewanella vesiculosa]NCP69748.1 signal peptide peptidase SppA [Shewanella vesiculosa]|tara:strand:- start:6896 stop:8740 length:1845 start_codon:yes stop_codon:yes gene_type:complete
MSAKPSFLKRMFLLLWNTVNGIRKLIINIIFFGLLAVIAVVLLNSEDEIVIEDQTALVLNLSGSIVDQKHYVDPIEMALKQGQANDPEGEMLLADILYTINNATEDKRINSIVLDLANLQDAGISKMTAIGEALNQFKAADKSVIAMANGYDQNQYFLASFADKIYLNNQGMVSLDGLSRYRLYYKAALDKLKITTHVFRVGTFKSAVEPFIRDDMSDADKQASKVLLNDIWQSYSTIVASNRQIAPDQLVLTTDEYLAQLDKAEGDSAKMAINMKWVDELVSADAFRVAMIERVGSDKEGKNFKQISFNDYRKLTAPMPQFIEHDSVAVIVAKGTILNGKQPAGQIGGESTSALLMKARFDDKVKAVVLRVDSPGGSAFASEQIRQEVLALKAAGKPVVVSMGSLAASGGYWISASADYIVATPTTLTGSIGIFGMFATFEQALSHFGVTSDGVATSEWAGLSPVRELSPQVAAVIQRHIERGYHEFISLVATERHMTLEQVDEIAQGRVWTGKRALTLGLVDELGDMDIALAKAADLAKMDKFDVKVIEQELSAEQQIMQQFMGAVAAYVPDSVRQTSIVEKFVSQWAGAFETLSMFDDPNHAYLYCENCNY